MRKFRIISLMLAVLMSFSVVASCTEKNESASSVESSSSERPYEEKEEILIGKNGESEFKILLPANASSTIEFAAEELNWIVREGFGKTLEIVEESENTDLNEKWISIGDTRLAQTVAVSYEDVGLDGYRLKTKDNSIVMRGYSDRGNIFAVYGFAEKTFGFDLIADDEIYIERRGQDIKTPIFDLIEKPDIAGRQMDWYNVFNKSDNTAIRFKLNGATQNLQEMHGGNGVWSSRLSSHTSYTLLPKDKYYPSNSDWYYVGEDGHGQLCLTNEEMRAELIKNLMKIIEEEPAAEIFMVSQEDWADYCCACDKCQEEERQYTASGYWLRFVNKVADEVKEILANSEEETLKARANRVKIGMFAYGFTEVPPTKYDADEGKNVPIKDENGIPLKARDNVVVYFAPIYNDVYHTLTDPVYNVKYKNAVEGWSEISENIAVWLYGAPSYRMRLIDNYSTLAQNFKILRDNGCIYINFAGSFGSEGTPFYDLEVYLISHLMWDVDQDVNVLLDRFFTNYYKEAAEPVREYFEQIRAHCMKMDNEATANGDKFHIYIPYWGTGVMSVSELRSRYPKKYLEKLSQTLDRATEIVDKMSDGVEKEILRKRVLAETLAPRFWEIALWYETFDVAAVIDDWKRDAQSIGLDYPTGDWSLDKIYSEWKLGNYHSFITNM